MRGIDPVILLVDDDEETYNLYSDFLASSGFSVIGASDGEEAVRVAQRLGPTLIIMDLGLPLLDGCEATRQLRSDPRTQHIPILAMTGFVQRHIVELARQAGCDAFLAKPCPLERLLGEARRLIGLSVPPASPDTSHILIVEDDDEIREAMVLVLEQQGYLVNEARNGREALELLQIGETPRLILLDLMMPVMDGWRFLQEAHRRFPDQHTPVVLLSAVRELSEEARKLGVACYLPKPFNLDDVVRLAHELGDSRHDRHAV
jgi:CheY-like chemotaxis protein